MQKIKKLKNIKPFNKFLFKSCYYHQLIAAFSKYGVDEKMILMNHFPIYNTKSFQDPDITIYDNKEIEEKTGLRIIRKKSSKNIINEIIKTIDRGIPIIIAVDCCYLPYREDTYKKQHISHFILIYGYNKTTKTFTINEHMYLNSIKYIEREVEFKVIKQAFNNYLKRLFKKEGAGITKIKRVSKSKADISISYYRKAIIKNKDKIKSSQENLINYCKNIALTIDNKENFLKNIKQYISDIIIIRHKKQIQKFQMSITFNNDEINNNNDRALENLIFLFGIIIKIDIANFYNEKSIEKVKNRLYELIELEKRLYNFLFGDLI